MWMRFLLVGLGGMFFLDYAWAEAVAKEAIRPDLAASVKMGLALAAGLGMALATFGGAIGQGRAISAAMEGISRNPDAQPKIFIPMVVGLALIESLVLMTFIVANGLSVKI